MQHSDDDFTILDSRQDNKFSQKVRNIKSHDTLEAMPATVGDRDRQWHIKGNAPGKITD